MSLVILYKDISDLLEALNPESDFVEYIPDKHFFARTAFEFPPFSHAEVLLAFHRLQDSIDVRSFFPAWYI